MNLRKEKKTVHVGIALDESGSMMSCKRETLDGLNEQLQELRKHSDIDTTVTFITFAGDKDVKVKFSAKPIAEVADLKESDYNPDGGTAMYDGVALVLNTIKQNVADDDSCTYLILVVSDGGENSSREFTSQQVADMIKERQDTKKWTITYIGANQDLSVIKKSFNIGTGNSMSYVASAAGTRGMWDTLANSTQVYYSARASMSNEAVMNSGCLSTGFIQPIGSTSASNSADTTIIS